MLNADLESGYWQSQQLICNVLSLKSLYRFKSGLNDLPDCAHYGDGFEKKKIIGHIFYHFMVYLLCNLIGKLICPHWNQTIFCMHVCNDMPSCQLGCKEWCEVPTNVYVNNFKVKRPEKRKMIKLHFLLIRSLVKEKKKEKNCFKLIK